MSAEKPNREGALTSGTAWERRCDESLNRLVSRFVPHKMLCAPPPSRQAAAEAFAPQPCATPQKVNAGPADPVGFEPSRRKLMKVFIFVAWALMHGGTKAGMPLTKRSEGERSGDESLFHPVAASFSTRCRNGKPCNG